MPYGAAAHRRADDVAVAVRDLTPGETIEVRILEGGSSLSVRVRDAIPLGHKVALKDLPKDKELIEYGERIGRVVQPIATGVHVHVHNIKSLRWSA
ncbi:MAG: UxaA family hydrolase [bacterium]